MNNTFTSNERELINTAFTFVLESLMQGSMGMSPELENALKIERTNTSSMGQARANILYNFWAGFEGEVSEVADLYMIRPGLREAHILGAQVAKRYAEILEPQTRVLIKRAIRARAAEFERRMVKINHSHAYQAK